MKNHWIKKHTEKSQQKLRESQFLSDYDLLTKLLKQILVRNEKKRSWQPLIQRAFYIDVGQMPPFKAEAFIERMKDQFKKNKTPNTRVAAPGASSVRNSDK